MLTRLIQRTESVSEGKIECEYEYRDAEYESVFDLRRVNTSASLIATVRPQKLRRREHALQKGNAGILRH
jgi:hypothetical protein